MAWAGRDGWVVYYVVQRLQYPGGCGALLLAASVDRDSGRHGLDQLGLVLLGSSSHRTRIHLLEREPGPIVGLVGVVGEARKREQAPAQWLDYERLRWPLMLRECQQASMIGAVISFGFLPLLGVGSLGLLSDYAPHDILGNVVVAEQIILPLRAPPTPWLLISHRACGHW